MDTVFFVLGLICWCMLVLFIGLCVNVAISLSEAEDE